MQTVETELDRLKRKAAGKDSKLENTIDSLLADIEGCIQKIEEPTNWEADDPSINGIIKNSCQKIVSKKYVANMQATHKDYYNYVSKLGKTIDKVVDAKINDANFYMDEHKEGLLRLVDMYQEERAKSEDELSKSQISPEIVFYSTLLELLKDKKVLKCFELLENYIISGATLPDNELVRSIYKLVFWHHSNAGEINLGIKLFKEKFQKDSITACEEIGQLLHLTIIKNEENIPNRLKHLTQDNLIDSTISFVTKKLRKLKGLPETSIFLEVISVGISSMPVVMENAQQLEGVDHDDVLHIALDVPKNMNHHSLIHCPITRDLCNTSSNRAMLQKCGHIVGEASVKKMIESREQEDNQKMFKCPTCPNKQKLETMRAIIY